MSLRNFLNSDGDTYKLEYPYTLDGETCRKATDEEIIKCLKKKEKDQTKKIIFLAAPILSLIVSFCCKNVFGNSSFICIFLCIWCALSLLVLILELGFSAINFTVNFVSSTIEKIVYKLATIKDIILYKGNKRFLYVIIALCAVAIMYQLFFRYKYRTYKGNYNQVQVIKVDTLTGKSTVTFPEYVENNKK